MLKINATDKSFEGTAVPVSVVDELDFDFVNSSVDGGHDCAVVSAITTLTGPFARDNLKKILFKIK